MTDAWIESGLSNPFAAMSYLTPVMAFITLIFSLAIEPWHELSTTAYFDTSRHIFESCALMLLGGALAFFMVHMSMVQVFLLLDMIRHSSGSCRPYKT